MESESTQAMVLAGIWAVIPIVATTLLIGLASRAAKGRLRRNPYYGIRTPSTMRSDDAWVVGHRAAKRLTPIYLVATVVSCVALFAVAIYVPKPTIVIFSGFSVLAFYVVLLLYTAFVASKAAKSADGPAPGRRP